MTDAAPTYPDDITEARRAFPATATVTYLNTAAVGLASAPLIDGYERQAVAWREGPFDFVRGEAAGEVARAAAAGLMGADARDVALIPAVSTAAGLVAAQFGAARSGENIVIGEREYSSNHFPWRLLAGKGYDVRLVPFRGGGLQPEDVARCVDGGTMLVAFSAVQTATGHRSDVAALGALAQEVGALVFVDGSQWVGAMPVADDLAVIDVLATADHKFLLHPARGMGYCYLSSRVQERFTPVHAGWKAGRVPFESFFGPDMELSPTASRFDHSISWIAALGNEVSLSLFGHFGADRVFARNRDLAEHLRATLAGRGIPVVELPVGARSTIVAVSPGDADPVATAARLRDTGIVVSARDGLLRLAVHVFNHEDDAERVAAALASL